MLLFLWKARRAAIAAGVLAIAAATSAHAQGTFGDQLRQKQRKLRAAEDQAAANEAHEKTLDWLPMDGVYFAELGWSISLGGPPSRVPEPVIGEFEPDDRSIWESGGMAWDGRIGGIYKNIYASAGFTRMSAGHDGTSPGSYDVRVGVGGVGRYWSEGGPATLRSTTSRMVDRFGNECPKIEKDDDEADRYMKMCKVTHMEVTTSEQTINIPPGWKRIWVAGYGGWRHVHDLLGGEQPDDATSPLVSGGGPIVGASFLVNGQYWAAEFGHELVYYAHGWDDHGSFGYGGYAGIGAAYFTMDLRWRLDPATGRSFFVGGRARFDWFDG